ncbi:MAG: T9SS type A sorting domain-containing protein, partial [Bacteroidia bacterium]
GETYCSSTVCMDWSLGEVMTESFAGTIVLTQGVLQPYEVVTSMDALSSEFGSITVFPNPTTGSLAIKTEKSGTLTVELFDMNGTCMLHENFSTTTSRIDLLNLPLGIYILRLSDNKQAARSMLVKKI